LDKRQKKTGNQKEKALDLRKTFLYYNPAAFSEQVVQAGTTAVFSDMHDLANALGLSEVRQVLKDVPRNEA
jgi:hypothetical protein